MASQKEGKTARIVPTYKQQIAWNKLQDDTTRFIVFGGGAGGGKSWLGCEWLLTNCFFYPGSRWFIGRDELSRLMKSSFVTFEKVCAHHGFQKSQWKLNGQYNYITFTNGSRIDLLDLAYKPSDPFFERFGSLEYTGGWVEEASEVNFGAFDVLKSRVGRHENKTYSSQEVNPLPKVPKIFLTCNPKKNWLYQMVYKPYKKDELPKSYYFIQSLYGDNPHTSDEYGASLSEIKDKATKQRLMFGNWEYEDAEGSLMEYDSITDLFSNSVPKSDQRFMVADIARFGQDKTVVMFWKGYECYMIKTWEKQGLDVTADKIRELARKEKVPFSRIVIDEDGVGGGVVDALQGVKGFVNNSTPIFKKTTKKIKENYANLKTQCAYVLAEKVNAHKIAIKTEDMTIREKIIEEMEQIKRKDPDKDGKLMIIPKDEVKELVGRSPDYSDCLLMRMYFSLMKIGETFATDKDREDKIFSDKMKEYKNKRVQDFNPTSTSIY